MNQTQVHISWASYLNNVSKEFTFLQQNAEFVDLTLAAEGHLVKVHKNIVAIASPYIKAMLQSTSCQHPVIFLNNISHKVLSYILEYIYTGEVDIPPDIIDRFIEACKSLCIRGVDGIAAPKLTLDKQAEPQEKGVDKPTDNFAACITINNIDNNYDLQVVSNEKNINSQGDVKPLPLALPIDVIPVPVVKAPSSHVDLGTECEANIDINNINNFIIQNSRSSSNNTESKKMNPNKAIIKISEEIIVPSQIPSIPDSSLVNINTNTGQDFVNITLNNNGWQIQQPSEAESSYNPIQHPVTVTFNSNDYQDNPNESSSLTHGDPVESNVTTEYSQLTYKTGNTRIRKFGSLAKDTKPTKNKLNRIEMDKKPHYTISTRGSLQLLLNRFLYHSHHHSNGGRKRRWRCINYRKMHCPACIDTDDDNIIAVMESHCHPDHDVQIRKKIKSNKIFTSLTAAVNTIEDDIIMKRHSKLGQSNRNRNGNT